MRDAFIKALLQFIGDERICFLTGDLGFRMLEPLEDKLGKRFINAGIAEQNMISVAAGLCREGWRPWVYSIAPFCYARPFEQVRNDICLHDLPVRLIGGGAGFGYGLAGPSHHAIEDCAVMSVLQNMTVFVPSFSCDMLSIVRYLESHDHPCYIRLGRDERSDFAFKYPPFAPFRILRKGIDGVIVVLGSMAGSVTEMCHENYKGCGPSIWSCSKLPFSFGEIPSELKKQIVSSNWTMIIEDHVAVGGLGDNFSRAVLSGGINVRKFAHLHVLGYVTGNVGSQEYYRKENRLDLKNISKKIDELTEKR